MSEATPIIRHRRRRDYRLTLVFDTAMAVAICICFVMLMARRLHLPSRLCPGCANLVTNEQKRKA